MKVTVVRYKVKADRAQENIDYISAVFAELAEKSPPGVRYVAFNLEDGVSFVHVAAVDDDMDGNPLPQLDAFKRFAADIKDRCDEAPVASAASIVGSYGAFS